MSSIEAEELESRAEPVPSERLERCVAWVLRGPLTVALACLLVGQLALWVPHYLTWPWFSDHDVFATAALGWDNGLRPYRDIFGNNFPGTTYLFWLVGKVFGWGKTAPIYAIDAALVLLLGGLLLAWSRRRFGRLLPGLVGFATFLGYYLTLDYSQAAQRDWQGPACAVIGLLIAESWPGWAGWIVSALGFALALSIRPHPVLFLPALLAALDEGARPSGAGPRSATARAALGWGVAFLGFLALAFAPLVWSGILGDFLRSLKVVTYGNSYNRVTAATFFGELVLQLSLKVLAVPIATLLLLGRAAPATRRVARTWLLAMLGVLFYRPISPLTHAYLTHPLMLIWSVNVAVLAELVLESGLAPTLRLSVLLLVLGLEVTIKPRFSNPVGSLKALPALRRGTDSIEVPPGYARHPRVPLAAWYDWEDYRGVLHYLRKEVDPGTRVANALKAVPAINGPAGRLPVFPAESVAWLLMIRPDDEETFIKALEQTPDSVVVWVPAEEFTERRFHFDDLTRAIRRLYEPIPAAKFGPIEVWRRRTAPTTKTRTKAKTGERSP